MHDLGWGRRVLSSGGVVSRVSDRVDQELVRYTSRGVPLLVAILAGIRELTMRGAQVDAHGAAVVRELRRRADRLRRELKKRPAPPEEAFRPRRLNGPRG